LEEKIKLQVVATRDISMQQYQTQHEYSADARHHDARPVGWKVFWSISWMIFVLFWILVFWLMSVFPWIQAFWWPFILPRVLVVMFAGMFFLYRVFPKRARDARQRQTVPSAYSPMSPPDRVYEPGYQQQRSGEIWKNVGPQFQSRSTWDDEQPQASYPEEPPPGLA
jgi:glucan phosphoethanolaminetransferase (alkaline phosphatase superfamily)